MNLALEHKAIVDQIASHAAQVRALYERLDQLYWQIPAYENVDSYLGDGLSHIEDGLSEIEQFVDRVRNG